MSAGCAVITTNTSGCHETVGETGLLINPNDTIDLKLKLNQIINDQYKLVELQKVAVERVKKVYDWNVLLKEYVKIYE